MHTLALAALAVPSLKSLFVLLLWLIGAAILWLIFKAVASAAGWTIPDPIMKLIGLGLLVIVILWFFFGAGG